MPFVPSNKRRHVPNFPAPTPPSESRYQFGPHSGSRLQFCNPSQPLRARSISAPNSLPGSAHTCWMPVCPTYPLSSQPKTREIAFDQKGCNPLVPQLRIHVCKYDEESGLQRIGDPKFPAVENPPVPLIDRPAREGKCVASGRGLR